MKKYKEVSDFYEQDASNYDHRWTKRGGAGTSAAQLQIVEAVCESWSGCRILEIGCGSGRFSSTVARNASYAAYLDLSHGMLRISRGKLSEKNLKFEGLQASAYRLPFAPDYFDCIISINVFNHLKRPDLALREICRVLNAGGRLLVNFANLNSIFWPAAFYINRRGKSVGRDVYSRWHSRRKITQWMLETKLITLEVSGNVFVPHYLDFYLLREIPLVLDRISKKTRMKLLAPSLFYHCIKVV